MKRLILVSLLVIISCKTESKLKSNAINNSTTFYFFRHAEKEFDGTHNPDLSIAGKKRAQNYGTYFKDIKIDAIYTTDFKRTKNTIQPIAENKKLEPIIYNPSQINYTDFVSEHKNQTLLIVGHSNTTPDFANKIIGKMTYDQIDENNFSNIYKVTIINSKIISELLK